MSTPFGRHALVIGAGMAGLAAARVLSEYFDSVIVLERDALPADASARPGTPQSNHPHALLLAGQHALCELFPGFNQDLAEAGAVLLRGGLDAREELPGYDPFPQRDLGWTTYSMSRPLIELVTRRCVQRLHNVTFRERCRVLEILPDSGGSAVGLRYKTSGGDPEELPADLVVDASGRGALTLAFLEGTGRPQPEQTTVGIDIAYATATFAVPEGKRDWKLVVTYPDMPADSKGGFLFPAEGDRWMVTLAEWHSGLLPEDGDVFLKSVQQLRTNTIYDAIKNATRLGEIRRFGFPESTWRHYEGLTDLPRGLLPIGDAICRFNPIYGQGMSVAAQEARVLRDLLRSRRGEKDPLTGLGRAFIAGVQPVLATAWSASAVPDFLHPQTRGERPENLKQSLRFSAALKQIAAGDPGVHKLMMMVRHLVEPPRALQSPELVQRVAAGMGKAR
jgi:2-polyprenyl-6-methoxyphenol hydroxylase-like FAD-dependent oxidoreductase